MLPFVERNISNSAPSRYFFIGINIASSINKLEVAIVKIDTPSPGTPITLIKSMSFDLPQEIGEAYIKIKHKLQNSEKINTSRRQSNANIQFNEDFDRSEDREIQLLRSLIVSVQEEAVRELLREVQLSIEHITAVTLANTGFVYSQSGTEASPRYFNVNDGKELAQKLRTNVIHSFFYENALQESLRQLSLPYWTLLSDKNTERIFIDFGKTLRWYYLPRANNASLFQAEVKYREVISCGSLLDSITQEATQGKQVVDNGGELSMKGNLSRDLLTLWESKYNFLQTHHPSYQQNELFYVDVLRDALNNTSPSDVLNSASHWIVQNLENSLVENLDRFSSSCPIIITGAALHNSLLKRLIREKFEKFELRRLASYGFLEDSFDAVATSVLGLLVAPCNSPKRYQSQTFAPRKMIPGGVLSTSQDSFQRFRSYLKERTA